MSKPIPTLAALSLALVLALAAAPAFAQEITTSHGLRTLPRTDGMTSAPQFQQAARVAEDVLVELLQDLSGYESSRSRLSGESAGLTEKVQAANAEYERAKAAFETLDQQYRTDLASFQQRQAALEADIARQRTAAAAVNPTMPLDQYNAEVTRVNAWGTRISEQRTQLEAERNRLLASHDNVEAERAKLAAQRASAEEKLKQTRDANASQYGSADKARIEAYKQLRVTSNYLRNVREQMKAVAKVDPAPSPVLDEATSKLRIYESQ
jgi:DNA repair exonuclease SbcCD ATPase subunit